MKLTSRISNRPFNYLDNQLFSAIPKSAKNLFLLRWENYKKQKSSLLITSVCFHPFISMLTSLTLAEDLEAAFITYWKPLHLVFLSSSDQIIINFLKRKKLLNKAVDSAFPIRKILRKR